MNDQQVRQRVGFQSSRARSFNLGVPPNLCNVKITIGRFPIKYNRKEIMPTPDEHCVEANDYLKKKDVAAATPRHHATEQVTGHLIGTESTLAAKCAGDPVLVFDSEDPTLHDRQPNSGRPRNRRRSAGEDPFDLAVGEPTKRTARGPPLEHGDLELIGAQ